MLGAYIRSTAYGAPDTASNDFSNDADVSPDDSTLISTELHVLL